MAGYGDDAGLDAWLSAHGYTWPVSGITKAVGRERGSAYIDGTYGDRFPGSPTGGYAQERAWPRTGATTYAGSEIPSDTVPAAVINASYAAAWVEAQSPGTLAVIATGSAVIKREKVASLETEYAIPDGSAGGLEAVTPTFAEVEGLLRPFLAAPLPYPMVV